MPQVVRTPRGPSSSSAPPPPVLSVEVAALGRREEQVVGALPSAQASTTGRTSSDNGTRRERPLLVVARSITAPVRPDCGSDRLTTRPGYGTETTSRTRSPRNSPNRRPVSAKDQSQVGVPAGEAALSLDDVEQERRREKGSTSTTFPVLESGCGSGTTRPATPGAGEFAPHIETDPQRRPHSSRRPHRPGHCQVHRNRSTDRRHRRDGSRPNAGTMCTRKRALVGLPRPHRHLTLPRLSELLGQLTHGDPTRCGATNSPE